jgi:type IV pilus assembly protein PilQ
VNKVPLLGDIPIFGYLFKQTNKTNDKTELLIFLTPRIVKESVTAVR